MKSKKYLILAVTISFPVILYLFLRFFGQNNYDLPYYFKEDKMLCSEANGEMIFLNTINREDSIELTRIFDQTLSLVILPDLSKDNQPLINELRRTVQNLEGKVNLSLLAIYADSINHNSLLSIPEKSIRNFTLSVDRLDQLMNCHFKLPNAAFQGIHPLEEIWPNDEIMVLVDQQGYIRGYYNGFETKEVDRLILEINVLLSKN